MPTFCLAGDCNRPVVKRGYCEQHYRRFLKYGDPNATKIRLGFSKLYPEEYRCFKHMKSRCNNPNNKRYSDYGGRGIKVCSRWMEPRTGFYNFLQDLGPKPNYEKTDSGKRPKLTLDRIDVNGGYSPENCRWVGWGVQRVNQRREIS